MGNHWDRQTYEREKRNFIELRVNQAPLWSQFSCLFGVCWGAAWLCSWGILRFAGNTHIWARSLSTRYALAFVFAYACFFVGVRIWIDFVKRSPQAQSQSSSGLEWLRLGEVGGEGCLFVLAAAVLGFVIAGLFFFFGGAPLLLEAAFEAAFAGVVVRRLSGNWVLGGWKMRLLQNTWKQALLCLVFLLTVATCLHRAAPQATTFAEAVRLITK
jgi:hypothetical protein